MNAAIQKPFRSKGGHLSELGVRPYRERTGGRLSSVVPACAPGDAHFGLSSKMGLLFALILLISDQMNAATRLSLAGTRGFPGVEVFVPMEIGYPTNVPPNVVALQADI